MRTSLMTSPKVNGIARYLETSKKACQTLSTGYNGTLSEIVTRNVTRCVTVSSLLVIWGAANEHTKDGIFHNADLSDIDDMVGIPDFGAAMESVGWAIYDEEIDAVILPNFSEYNTVGEDRKSNAADRQRRYRERKKALQSDITSDVTRYVTSDGREEKRREDIKDQTPHIGGDQKQPVDNFSGDNDPDPEANNNVLNDYVPPGGSGAIGKFTIHENWNPDTDFMRRAALWGISLKTDVTPFELADFITYWKAEGKAFHHDQWQQKLARSVQMSRARPPAQQRRDVNAISEPDSDIPEGFRG